MQHKGLWRQSSWPQEGRRPRNVASTINAATHCSHHWPFAHCPAATSHHCTALPHHIAAPNTIGIAASQVAQALQGSVLPALRKACRRLLRLKPEEKTNFDSDCVLLCVMENKLGGAPLPIFYYQEPCCANAACRADKRENGSPLLKCTGCSGMALYCSKDCQLRDRLLHKQHCKLAQLIPQEQMQGFLQAADQHHT